MWCGFSTGTQSLWEKKKAELEKKRRDNEDAKRKIKLLQGQGAMLKQTAAQALLWGGKSR